ncbi:hypothetical protein BDZ89DRAFT_1132883 [Hymenopellis radicata]|nr:hypothetical protein BDZ89DRAFT_1132883 [Hymenopellis radicata]
MSVSLKHVIVLCAYQCSVDNWATRTKLDQLGSADPREEPARSGRFIVETTEWGLIQRPDYVSVVHQVGSATPLRVVSKVAATIIDQPGDALFVIGVNTNTQEIGINVPVPSTEVQSEHEVYNARYPSVTRVRRNVSYSKPLTLCTARHITVERRVIW